MLTKLMVRNFKRFGRAEIELGETVVFIGPNNSGKTSALQALALWELGLRKWTEKRARGSKAKQRVGVLISRRDLLALPVPSADHLWRDLHVREGERVGDKTRTQNVRIEVVVEGVTEGRPWSCGFEFDYRDEESFYCRPLRLDEEEQRDRMEVPREAIGLRMAFLPPMSGLFSQETRLDAGAVAVRIGEGRTAEVLRNLCHAVASSGEGKPEWERLAERIRKLFGVEIEQPQYVAERGEITMRYRDRSGAWLDISAAGRGLHQTLLLLAYMQANPGAVLLLDEPDAHLEVLRQRQTYQLLTEVGREKGNQVIAASHSEVVMNEAADRDMVVAFVGPPHRIDDRGHQVLKALKEIGFEHYYQAEVKGWVLYLEGSTDLAVLQAFAATLGHPAREMLERPFIHYVGNQPARARGHFHGLREAKRDLVGIAIFDQFTAPPLMDTDVLRELMWTKREIENFLCLPEVLDRYAAADAEVDLPGPLFAAAERDRRLRAMRECVEDRIPRVALRDRADRWWTDTKASDEFLDPLFEDYFRRLELPNLMRKTDYHQLARLVPPELIDPEIEQKLDVIAEIGRRARPRGEAE